jgi:hypothetical protein
VEVGSDVGVAVGCKVALGIRGILGVGIVLLNLEDADRVQDTLIKLVNKINNNSRSIDFMLENILEPC